MRRQLTGRKRAGLVLAASIALCAVAGACSGGDEVGVVAGGALPAELPAVDASIFPGDPVVTSTTGPPTLAPVDVAPPSTVETAQPTTTTPPTLDPPLPRPPVPLPSDPAAVVLRLAWHGGYPAPGGSLVVQPIELQAGGRLVRPARPLPVDPSSAHHRLEAFELPVTEVQALVSMAEDAGATVPPADLGHDPDMADAGVLVITVDRPGLRSELVVRDPFAESSDARGLTPDQMARRRAVLELVTRVREGGRAVGPVRDNVRVVAFLPRTSSGTTATTRPTTALRTWTGPAFRMGALWGCVDVPFADLDLQVPGWSSATSDTRWRWETEVLQIAFHDATSPTDGCGRT